MNRLPVQVALLAAALSAATLLSAEAPGVTREITQGDRSIPTPFTHFPVNLTQLFSAARYPGATPITPFFSYDNTAHAEGPRKWYLYGSQTEPLKVFLPTRASLRAEALRRPAPPDVLELNGERVWPNMNVTFQVDHDLSFFFMHLCLREEISRRVEQNRGRASVLQAGTHIGYVHYPPWNSLDFGVEDRRRNSAMAADPQLWWNLRVNPLDYFVPSLHAEILEAYAPVLERLRSLGTVPYSDLTDSRANVNVPGTLWGVWFKDDLEDPFRDHAVNWSIINCMPTSILHLDTYWKTLREDPDHDGLFTENGDGPSVGPSLYRGRPLGRSRFYRLSGDLQRGTARIVSNRNSARRVFLKFEVFVNDPANPHDDQLLLESHAAAEEAVAAAFSEHAVRFRRNPFGSSRSR